MYMYVEKNDTDSEKSIIEKEKDLINAGILAKRAGDYEKSIEYYRKAVALSPQNGNSYYALGKVLYIGGHYEEAFRAYLLAYLHNAHCLSMDLFIHAGHAILDAENSKNYKYDKLIREYTASIKGRTPLVTGKAHQAYMDVCEAKGREEILRQAKSLSQE